MLARGVTLMMLLVVSLPGIAGNAPDIPEATVTIKMEDCKATRRGRLDPEDLKDTAKLLEKLKGGWPKDELIKRGVIEVDASKYYLYLPKAKSYSVKNSAASDHSFENTSTVISINQGGSNQLREEDGWPANLPIRLGDKMFDVADLAADGSTLTLKPSSSPLRGVIAGRSCPPFSFKTMEGKTITLEGLSGRIVVLDFWSVT